MCIYIYDIWLLWSLNIIGGLPLPYVDQLSVLSTAEGGAWGLEKPLSRNLT